MRIVQTAEVDWTTLGHAREWIYNGLDVCVTLEVFNAIAPQLDEVTSKTYDFSRALQGPVLEMSMRGLLVDQRKRQEVLRMYRDQIDRVSAQLDRLISEGIGAAGANWRSPKQLSHLLYTVMQLPPVRKRSADGKFNPTTNREALEKLGAAYFIAEPIINHLLLLRDIDKKRQQLETGIDSDGRMRTNLNIAGTNTGRLASALSDFGTGGNQQNIDRELRSVFIADEGMKFCNLDLEQADARNVGAICWNHFVESHGEAYAGSYLDACESGDLHTSTSKLVWPDLGWTGDPRRDREIAEQLFYRQDSYRQMAKKGGHGTNFFGQPPNMARHLKVTKDLIDDFQQRYFAAYPCIGTYLPKKNDPRRAAPTWHNKVYEQLNTTGSITSLLGRRRSFFGRPTEDDTLKDAIAYEPQSCTADEINLGMLRVWRANRVQLLIQVHDSILFQFPQEREAEIVPWALEQLRTTLTLQRGREFTVPVEAKTGWNWGDGNDKNPDGLMKWKGNDKRSRSEKPRAQLSLSYL